MRALVTGGAGFIGGHIVRALRDVGHHVVVIDSLDPRVHPEDARPPEAVAAVIGDIRDAEAVRRALAACGPEGPDVVFHEAAMVGVGKGAADAADFMDVNVQGTVTLYGELARLARRPRVVLASSVAIYGEGAYGCPSCGDARAFRKAADLEAGRWEASCPTCGRPLQSVAFEETHRCEPQTAYAISKLAQELVALTLGRDLGVPTVALRYHNVYGPWMPTATPYAGVAAMFRSRLLHGEAPLVHEDGGQWRDFVHVDDVVAANLLAAEGPLEAVQGEAFHIGSGEPHRIIDLAAALAQAMKGPAPHPSGTYRPGDVRHVVASIEKARRVLGYRPRVSFDDGVARFATDPARPPAAIGAARVTA